VARRLFPGREEGGREGGRAIGRGARAANEEKREDESEERFLALVEGGGERAEGRREKGREGNIGGQRTSVGVTEERENTDRAKNEEKKRSWLGREEEEKEKEAGGGGGGGERVKGGLKKVVYI